MSINSFKIKDHLDGIFYVLTLSLYNWIFTLSLRQASLGLYLFIGVFSLMLIIGAGTKFLAWGPRDQLSINGKDG